jgi:hypothetical protein
MPRLSLYLIYKSDDDGFELATSFRPIGDYETNDVNNGLIFLEK